MIRAYIYGVLVINKNNFEDHLKPLEMVLQRLVEAGLKVNAKKYFFVQTENEYLGFWLSNNRVRPLLSKVEAVKAINIPNKVCNVRRFVGLVNYYRYMWHKHAPTLALLTKLWSTKVNYV